MDFGFRISAFRFGPSVKRNAALASAMGLALILGGCSQAPTDAQAGSGNSAAPGTETTSGTSPAPQEALSRPPKVAAAPADSTPIADRKPKAGDEVAVMETSLGRVVLMFFPDKAPNTIANFKYLASKGFYDGIRFHRIIADFMIQGGDPNTKAGDPATWGSGGPGYTIEDEFSDIKHVPGILSMANTGAPNSAGSQFFIMVSTRPPLDGHYSAFGKVVDGMDAVEKIRIVHTGENDRPDDPPVIKSVKIVKWPVK